MLFIDFRDRGLKNIFYPSFEAIYGAFFVDTETNVQPLSVPWYFIFIIDNDRISVLFCIQCLYHALLQTLSAKVICLSKAKEHVCSIIYP